MDPREEALYEGLRDCPYGEVLVQNPDGTEWCATEASSPGDGLLGGMIVWGIVLMLAWMLVSAAWERVARMVRA